MATIKSDEQRTGEIVLMIPSMKMLEIIVISTALDIALVEFLNMEGGRTGRTGTFRPSETKSGCHQITATHVAA